jgi:hypothetical protein
MRRPGFFLGLGLITGALCPLGWARPALAQSCPAQYAACDNGGCCLSSEQCCPKLQDGCCSSATPFCCPGGGCAATPSQCESASANPCDGYDVPCGSGCAPAGSDCCDLAGHYCGPESMCTSDTTCILGSDASMALEVTPITPPAAQSTRPDLSAPFNDPPAASERSCDLAAGGAPSPLGGLVPLLGAALVALRRGRRPRPRVATPPQSGSAC